MENSQYLIANFQPVTVLRLRDSRPNQAGESHVGRSLGFPPPPAAFYAAARQGLHSLFGTGEFRECVRGFAVEKNKTLFYPAPADLFQVPIREARRLNVKTTWNYAHPADPGVSVNVGSPLGPLFLRWPQAEDASREGFLMTVTQWRRYLQEQQHSDQLHNPADFFMTETRTGLKLGGAQVEGMQQPESRRYDEGMLYTRQALRLANDVTIKLAIETQNPAVRSGNAVVRLGGDSGLSSVEFERKDSELEMMDEFFDSSLADAIKRRILAQSGQAMRVKLCLLTPAVFSANIRALRMYDKPHLPTPAWRPLWMRYTRQGDRPATVVFLPQMQVELVGAATGKQFPLGSWDGAESTTGNDTAKKRLERSTGGPGIPQPLYRCLPAGAVYYLRIYANGDRGAALNRFFDRFWRRTLLVRNSYRGQLTKFGRMGFGITAIGVWDE